MLKKLAAAALIASLVPAAALACEGQPHGDTTAQPVEATAQKKELIAQSQPTTVGDAKKDATAQQQAAPAAQQQPAPTATAKKKPAAKQLSAPKATAAATK